MVGTSPRTLFILVLSEADKSSPLEESEVDTLVSLLLEEEEEILSLQGKYVWKTVSLGESPNDCLSARDLLLVWKRWKRVGMICEGYLPRSNVLQCVRLF